MSLPFHTIPNTPSSITSTHVIARMIDGLGFRYHWATEGLTDKTYHFKPCESSKNIGELMEHIYQLACMASQAFGVQHTKINSFDNHNYLRIETLNLYHSLSLKLKTMTDKDLAYCLFSFKGTEVDYPFWFMINGPIADALTHVGQITSWRRISGNPQPKGVKQFHGQKV